MSATSRSPLRERLTARLAEIGITVAPEEFTPAKGWYRTAAVADCVRWEAHGFGRSGVVRYLCSFDTMTDCARYGVTIEPGGYEVTAKRPAASPSPPPIAPPSSGCGV